MTDSKAPLLNHSGKPPVHRPKYSRKRSSFEASTYNSTSALGYIKQSAPQEPSDPGLSLIQMLILTVCMAGVQFTCKKHSYFFFFFSSSN
ncbi:hypothetical protein BC941DRAFT_200761 [Chlamydoabsidia padenii]|nr:hypothetical protein BC941DRAFT_200761 [Chlamydoabsidia padenii]